MKRYQRPVLAIPVTFIIGVAGGTVLAGFIVTIITRILP